MSLGEIDEAVYLLKSSACRYVWALGWRVGGLIGCGTRFISLEPGDIIATGTRYLGTLRDGASSDRRPELDYEQTMS